MRNNVAWKVDDKDKPHTTDHVEDALKVAGTLQEERKRLNEDLKWLKCRNDQLEVLNKSEDVEKQKFLEGANWMVWKAIDQNKETMSKINSLVDNYQEKKWTTEYGGSTLFASKNENWLID